jgi:hypothetical protein
MWVNRTCVTLSPPAVVVVAEVKRWRMYSILYIIGAIVVIIVVLKLLGLY